MNLQKGEIVMNREIRFRAWDTDLKVFLKSDHIDFIYSENETLILNGDFGGLSGRMIFQQFTGLKDKNRIDIYEGDILSVCNGSINGTLWIEKPYTVEYRLNKGFEMCMFCWDKEGSNDMDSTHWCEVVGNIYENPELLTK